MGRGIVRRPVHGDYRAAVHFRHHPAEQPRHDAAGVHHRLRGHSVHGYELHAHEQAVSHRGFGVLLRAARHQPARGLHGGLADPARLRAGSLLAHRHGDELGRGAGAG